jgi:hypothetical protein
MEALLRQSRTMCPFLSKTSPATLRSLSTTAAGHDVSPGAGSMSNLQVLGRRCPIMGKALAVQSARSGNSALAGAFGKSRQAAHFCAQRGSDRRIEGLESSAGYEVFLHLFSSSWCHGGNIDAYADVNYQLTEAQAQYHFRLRLNSQRTPNPLTLLIRLHRKAKTSTMRVSTTMSWTRSTRTNPTATSTT